MAPPSYCNIPHCHNTKYHFAFYKFPNNPELKQKWKDVCNIKETTKQMYACEKHFRSWDFTSGKKGKKKLKKGVIPTFLPDPNTLRKGKWWGPERKTNWLKSSEVTVVTMVENNDVDKGMSSDEASPKIKCSVDEMICSNKPLSSQYLNKLNPSKVKILIDNIPNKEPQPLSQDWLQNTSIFKLNSTISNEQSPMISQSTVNSAIDNSSEMIHNRLISLATHEESSKEVQNISKTSNLTMPKSYEVTIDQSGKIHMARPSTNVTSSPSDVFSLHTGEKNKSDIFEKQINPIEGENPAPYTVIINHKGMLDTIQTQPNMKIRTQPRDPKTGQLTLGKWPDTDTSNPMALHKQQLNVTKGQLGHLYRQWVSGKFSDSNETGNEQFNVMFSLFGSLMDTFKEVEKQNKILQMSLKRKNKPDNYSIKEKKAIIKETLQPYFGQDQIDIFLQHQTKRVREWSKDAIYQAETLRRCMSRSSYRKLRESKIFPLPSLTALKIHLEKFGGMPQLPSIFPFIREQANSEDVSVHSKKRVTVQDDTQKIVPSKRKKRDNSTVKQVVEYNEQDMLKLPSHIHEMQPITPVPSSASDGIMLVPVVHGSQLSSSPHEVVLAVDSIIPQ